MNTPAARLGPARSAIGRYEIDRKVGEGASGTVYRCHDPALDRDVAVKLAHVETLGTEQLRQVVEDFRHEAKIAGKFAHENIVTIHDVVTDEAQPYIVMEYVPGCSLDDYLKATGPLELDEALAIAHACCRGLAYIHYHGIVHRDIKPGNIMYHPAHGIVKWMDFSVAHKMEEPPLRDTGTVAYMAPEHFDPARRISHLTDIFALGATLYRLLTGRYPFSREHTAFQILHQDPEPIASLRPDVPAPAEAMIARAMAKADEDRYQSAAEFARAVAAVAREAFPDTGLLDAPPRYLLA
ncbi:MAG: serine/threonine protein kinase [Gammaproteobacteria bacterium]|nr:serine/threonine protein kinase [Gammaproteobacteria bacterium]MBI5619118.1 serine/threonine protein kinase [Gammaproteobacteria bacterium]